MNTRLLDAEKIVMDGAANLQRNAEQVGGKLYLTDQRLIFESHGQNIQKGDSIIPLPTIRGCTPCWTKILGIIPLIPNSLAVQTADGKQFRFVLFNRRRWMEQIERMRLGKG